MATHMGVQRYATTRNDQAEIFIDFVLQKWGDRLCGEGFIVAAPETTRHKHFERDDCSDVFDHFFELTPAFPVGSLAQGAVVRIWAQTTTYKGNARGKPEPNKTYEIRETLVEALGLRRWLRKEGAPFRTMHFTVGSETYTYGWFKLAKQNGFDVSLYPDPAIDMERVFARLAELFKSTTFEYEYYEALEDEIGKGETEVDALFQNFTGKLYNWFVQGAPACTLADEQADLLTELRRDQERSVTRSIQASRRPGADIKEQAIKLLTSDEIDESDPAMVHTVEMMAKRNPFISVALDASRNWARWSQRHFSIPPGVTILNEYVSHLWAAGKRERLINRRLLLRIHTDESINYIQDTNIAGLTEHNLYGGDHTAQQVKQITNQIVAACMSSGIGSARDLYQLLASKRGQQLVLAARIFEVKNGTLVRPSFFYVEEVLSDKFHVRRLSNTQLPKPIAYHAGFGDAIVRPYQNLKAVLSKKTNRPIAIIKAKFFRKPEFPRRAKEEAYVGFTTKYAYDGSIGFFGDKDNGFRERYPGIPLIMFVDMEEALDPPEYAVRRLVTAGWEVFFSVEELIIFLESRE